MRSLVSSHHILLNKGENEALQLWEFCTFVQIFVKFIDEKPVILTVIYNAGVTSKNVSETGCLKI